MILYTVTGKVGTEGYLDIALSGDLTGKNVYVNMTNKCPCSCVFCLRQTKKLVEGKDTAFLFEKSTGTKFKGAKSAEKGDGAEGGMTLEKLKAMNPLDRYNYSVNHPDEYKELYGGNE